MSSEFVEENERGYKIKTSKMVIGQKCQCPDKTMDVEKLSNDEVKLFVKKGSVGQKITTS